MMERRYYNADTLRAELANFEQRYGLSSEVAFEEHRAGQLSHELSYSDRFVWADLYREWRRLNAV